jgi:Flp pilus assembly protein TadG
MKQPTKYGIRRDSWRIKNMNLLFHRPHHNLRRHAGREDGQSIVEFAFALPFLAVMLLAIIYGGIMFYDYVTLANAVTVGARTLVVNRSAGATSKTNADACQLASTALTNAATNLQSGLINIVPETFQAETSSGTTTTGTSTCDALVQGEYATVTATYPCNLTVNFFQTAKGESAWSINLCPIPPSTGTKPNNCTQAGASGCISSTTTMRIE